MRVALRILLSIFALSFLTACAGAMPKTSIGPSAGAVPWANFDEAEQQAKSIVVGETTLKEFQELGFDYKRVPNTEIIPNVRASLLTRDGDGIDLLPPGAQACYRAVLECEGYHFDILVKNTKGTGNLFTRLIRTNRVDVTTGWRFELYAYSLLRSVFDPPKPGEVRLKDEKVIVFLRMGGTRHIDEVRKQENPLGWMGAVQIPGAPTNNLDTDGNRCC